MRPRDNPYSSDRISSLGYEPQGQSWEQLLARLAALKYRAAIVGPEGSGKTTLLEALDRRLHELGKRTVLISIGPGADRRPLWFLPKEKFRSNLDGHIVLLDSAERLGAFAWRQLCWRTRSAAGLVVTRHIAGGLPTLVETRTSPELLANLIARLDPSGSINTRDCRDLYSRHAGNLRNALREMYDRTAEALSIAPRSADANHLQIIDATLSPR